MGLGNLIAVLCFENVVCNRLYVFFFANELERLHSLRFVSLFGLRFVAMARVKTVQLVTERFVLKS